MKNQLSKIAILIATFSFIASFKIEAVRKKITEQEVIYKEEPKSREEVLKDAETIIQKEARVESTFSRVKGWVGRQWDKVRQSPVKAAAMGAGAIALIAGLNQAYQNKDRMYNYVMKKNKRGEVVKNEAEVIANAGIAEIPTMEAPIEAPMGGVTQ